MAFAQTCAQLNLMVDILKEFRSAEVWSLSLAVALNKYEGLEDRDGLVEGGVWVLEKLPSVVGNVYTGKESRA